MNKDELIQFIKDNLEISMDINTEFGPVEVLRIKLSLCSEVISEDFVNLPDINT